MADAAKPTGPDLSKGLPLAEAPAEGAMLAAHVAGEPAVLSRLDGGFHCVSGGCTHYGGPLGEGLCVGGEVRCPWHHARFCLKTGEAIAAPAIDPLDVWKVEVEGDRLIVRDKAERPAPVKTAGGPRKVVIVGGGAAGFAAAEMLRRRGYGGDLVMLSGDEAPPVDRPNLSKDYLAGNAPPEWIPLKPDDFYQERRIDLRLRSAVTAIMPDSREVRLCTGETLPYDALLLATGAEPVRLPATGFDQPNVFTLRSLADSSAIIAAAKRSRTAVVIGASFIGLETAASLRAHNLEVHVVAPESTPLEKVMGRELGRLIQDLHEQNGVAFHLGQTAERFENGRVRLSGGGELAADMVVVGVGVRPRTALAEAAGLATDRGVMVDTQFRTSAPGIFAAGDIARYPEARLGETVRVEHWVAAERQGQAAALAMLGEGEPFTNPPFFWSLHYDLAIRYVGSGAGFDEVVIDGSLAAHDATLRYLKGGRLLAAASIGRDHENLEIEARMQAGDM